MFISLIVAGILLLFLILFLVFNSGKQRFVLINSAINAGVPYVIHKYNSNEPSIDFDIEKIINPCLANENHLFEISFKCNRNDDAKIILYRRDEWRFI